MPSGIVISDTQYARADDGAFIAYRTAGSGDVDFLWVPAWLSHVELDWEWPAAESFLGRLSSLGRVVIFDKRGSGLSDRLAGVPDLETRAGDALAVLDAVGASRVVLFGEGLDGTALCAFLATAQPERVRALVLHHPTARALVDHDYPWGMRLEDIHAAETVYESSWGRADAQPAIVEANLGRGMSDFANDPAYVRFETRWQRYAASPGAAIEFDRVWQATDVRAVLASIRVPALVVLSVDWEWAEEVRFVSGLIPAADLREVPGRASVLLEDSTAVVEAVRVFLSRLAPADEIEVVLRALMFTDIVGSTERAAELGDRAWKDLVHQHHAVIRRELERYRGVEVDTAGDGFFATFDGPARAVRCAQSIVAEVSRLGLGVRAGVHTGECELIDGKPGGISVVIGSRVAALAAPGEVLVSQTVKDLTAGSGIAFAEHSEQELKGVPGAWRLYRAP